MQKKQLVPKIFTVTCHTDMVGPGSTFVAIKGYKEDGVSYIPVALEKGAGTIVVEHGTSLSPETEKLIKEKKASLLFVKDARKELARLSAEKLNYPANKLRIIAVTGTKGKTTTAAFMEHLLKTAGYKTARLTSESNAILDYTEPAALTTPSADYLHHFFDVSVKKGVEWVVLEVAAHALALDRTAGLCFDGIIFTNFESEHLEFFENDEEYFKAKLRIFEQLKEGAPAFVNSDNKECRKIPTLYPFVKTFGLDNSLVDITAFVDSGAEHRLAFTLPWKGRKARLQAPLIRGIFNMYNILGVIAVALEIGVEIEDIATALDSFQGIPGRQDWYQLPNGAQAVVDFAHTPGSFKAVLSLVRMLTDHLIVVCGAGGDRDSSKRARMGEVASRYADILILTSDNPRTESPDAIIDDILAGVPEEKVKKVICEVDRVKAIKRAYNLSRYKSIIAVLGKGTEETQIIGANAFPFSDVTVLKSLCFIIVNSLLFPFIF